MKGVKNIRPVYGYAALAGLIVLLLLAPCSVRNSIQDFFGVQQTEVSNKSKSAFNTSTCDTSETVRLLKTKTSETHHFDAVTLLPTGFAVSDIPKTGFSFSIVKQSVSGLSIPFYILYQRIKIAS